MPAATTDGLDQAKRQFQQFHLQEAASDIKQADQYAEDLREDGSWPDIDYTSKDRSAWSPVNHLVRVLAMARALSATNASSAQQEALTRSIRSAMAYWRKNDFRCPNWWFNNIGVPQKLGEIALILGDELPSEDFDYVTKTVMPRSAIGKSTGQNRVWLAGCTLMDGLLQRNANKVAKAALTIFSEAAVVTGKEGIQADFSFHQHGPQQQFGCYGLSFAADQIKWMTILQATPWAMSPPQVEVIRRYLLEGQNWVVWRGAMDISACGRQLAPEVPSNKGKTLAGLMTKMAGLDMARASEYEAFLKRNQPNGRNDLIGCRFFWCSDYLVHRRKDFCFTLKMCSKRVVGSESMNGQNLSGYYLADGATYLYRTGDEYKDVFPVWDWRMLPGVTCAQDTGPPPAFGSYRIDSAFVGAVTDGMNGCAVLDYKRDGVSARKSWFFGGDQIVCLGSAARATSEVKAPLVTTINQCRLRGNVRISSGKSETTPGAGAHNYDDLKWVEHDGVRYVLPLGQKVSVRIGKQAGSWAKVFQTSATPKADVSEDVFALSIEHGLQPEEGSYAYCILPAAEAAREGFEILSNTEKLQAVQFGPDLLEAVFYAPGRLDRACGHTVAVDSPCALLLDTAGGALRATVADPSHSLKSLALEIDAKKCDVQLPVGSEAGKSVRALIAE